MKRHHLRTVLATSDLSPGSDTALRTASVLAEVGKATLHAFHCVPEPGLLHSKAAEGRRARETSLRKRRRELEQQVLRVLGERSSAVAIAVELGSPPHEITRRASEISADVIVLGQHSPRVVFDDLLGTTADRILRTCEVPCLLAHRAIADPIARVLVATDFSEHARRALETVVDWVARPPAGPGTSVPPEVEVEILHVSAFASPFFRPIAPHPLLGREIKAARRRVPSNAPVTLRSSILSAALEVDGVTLAADRFQPDLVVLGTHGHGYLSRLLLGSVAHDVASTIRFPLLLVPLHGATVGFA